MSGSLVATGSDAEATSLSEEKASGSVTVHDPVSTTSGEEILPEDALLSPAQMSRFGSDLDWTEKATTDNLAGDGLLAPCQRERFADPDGLTELARTWKGSATRVVKEQVGKGDQQRTRKREVTQVESTAVQMVELSRDDKAAVQGFETASMWFAGCVDPRTQLVSTRTVKRVGDEARAFRLRAWGKQPATITVGVARTGSLVVTRVVTQPGQGRQRQGGTSRASPPRSTPSAAPTAPPPAPAAPAPPPTPPLDDRRATRACCPWSTCRRSPPSAARGSAPTPSAPAPTTPPPAATSTTFQGKGITQALTRTFVFPETPNASQLGLTQTVGVMKPAKARGLVEQVRTSDPAVRAGQPRHQRHDAGQLDVEDLGPERLGADDRAQRPAVVLVPDGDRPRRHGRLPARLLPRRQDDDDPPGLRRAVEPDARAPRGAHALGLTARRGKIVRRWQPFRPQRGLTCMRHRARLLTAALACTLALVGCGTEPSADDASGAGTDASDGSTEAAGEPEASATVSTEIPDDFPLASGMGGPQDAIGTSRSGTGLRDLTLCKTSPLRGLGLRDRMVADNSGGESANTRELVLMGSADEAALVARSIADLPQSCTAPDTSGGVETVTEVRESPFGPGPAATLVQTYTFDGEPGTGATVIHVVPTGAALLVTSTYGAVVARRPRGGRRLHRRAAARDRGRDGAVRRRLHHQEPTEEPTAITEIPSDFPLALGLPEDDGETTVSEPSADGDGMGEVEMCGQVVWPGAGTTGATRRLVTGAVGPEYFDGRELVVHAVADDAVAAMEVFRRAAQDCRTVRNQVWTVLDRDTGYDTVTVGLTYSDGLGSSVFQVSRVGAARLMVSTYGEGSLASLDAQADAVTGPTEQLVPAMCVFTKTGC